MKITSFEDINTIDAELASLFLRPDEAINWINAVEGDIKDWIDKHNKQYWEVVRYVSFQRGILGKLMADKKTTRLTRNDFAKVLHKFCPQAYKEDETDDALASSMGHYQFVEELKKIDETSLGHVVRQHVKVVEDLFDKQPIQETPKPQAPTLEDKVEEYLRATVDDDENRYPCSIVCVRPQYDNCCPALSVETYHSREFYKNKQPSHIVAYEFLDGVMTKEKLYELIGRYNRKRMIKLFVVSSKGLLSDVRILASDNDIGYIRLNFNEEMTSENYELPRSAGKYDKWRYKMDMLIGLKPMTEPLLIMDDADVKTSFKDVLKYNGVVLKKKKEQLYIPYLSKEEIEELANNLSVDDVETQIEMFWECGFLNVDLSIDPFSYVKALGLSYNTTDLDEDILGWLDVRKNHITLNIHGLNNFHRYRFTMAHELGHFLMHAPLFKEKGVFSIEESNETLNKGKTDRLEYQANRFASYLLMPEKLVRFLYGEFFYRYVSQVHGDKFHPLYYNPSQCETWESHENGVGKMSRLLGVSKLAMEYRLMELALLKKGGL